MEKITLKQILPYSIGYDGLKLHHFDDEREFTSVCIIAQLTEDEAVITDNEYEYAEDIEDLYPILRPMDLTKSIIVEGKEVIPILELIRVTKDYPIIEDIRKVNDGYHYSFKHEKMRYSMINCLYINSMDIMQFQWLFKHKFDVFGLIEKGLAIDCNTLETNPYL